MELLAKQVTYGTVKWQMTSDIPKTKWGQIDISNIFQMTL